MEDNVSQEVLDLEDSINNLDKEIEDISCANINSSNVLFSWINLFIFFNQLSNSFYSYTYFFVSIKICFIIQSQFFSFLIPYY